MPRCLVQHTQHKGFYRRELCRFPPAWREAKTCWRHTFKDAPSLPCDVSVSGDELTHHCKERRSPIEIQRLKSCLSFPEQKLWVSLTGIRRGKMGLCIQQRHLLTLSETLKALGSTTPWLVRHTVSGSHEGLYIFIISHKGSLALNIQSVEFCRDLWTRK